METQIKESGHWSFMKKLNENGYKSIGWLNSGITIPDAPDWGSVYINYTDCIHIIASESLKIYYTIDSGD